jgi:hypothetical protein
MSGAPVIAVTVSVQARTRSGRALTMEGGIAILLLVVIIGVALVVGAALYFTGGALWFAKDKDEAREGRFERPEHKEVTSETIENTRLAGTREDER